MIPETTNTEILLEKKLPDYNPLLEAHYEMNSIEHNLFLLLLPELHETADSNKEYVLDLRKTPSLTKIDMKIMTKVIDNLVSRVHVINKPNGNILAVTLMSVVGYDEKKKVMGVKISEKILPYLIKLRDDLRHIKLDIALNLENKISKRLYFLFCHYKYEREMILSLTDLKEMLLIKEQYTNWTAFKTKILDIAQKELNTKTDIEVKFDPIKTNKKITHVNFHIIPRLF